MSEGDDEAAAELPEAASRALALMILGHENITSRYQFAQFLATSAGHIRTDTYPDMKPADERPRDRLLRAIHVALATEVFKASEVVVANCMAGSREGEDRLRYILNLKQKDIEEWILSYDDDPDAELLREALCLMEHEHVSGLTDEERNAIGIVVDQVFLMVHRCLRMIRDAFPLLLKTRNHFSHQYGMMLYGNASDKSGELMVPLIRRDAAFKEDGTFGSIGGVLALTLNSG